MDSFLECTRFIYMSKLNFEKPIVPPWQCKRYFRFILAAKLSDSICNLGKSDRM